MGFRKSDAEQELKRSANGTGKKLGRAVIPRVFNAEPLSKAPPPPDWLPGPRAEKQWREQASAMIKAGMLYDTDLTTLAMYCAVFEQITTVIVSGKNMKPFLISQFVNLSAALGLAPKWRGSIDSIEYKKNKRRSRKEGEGQEAGLQDPFASQRSSSRFSRFRAGSS